MDDKSITDLISQFFPEPDKNQPDRDNEENEKQTNFLAEGLKAIVGQSGGALGTAVNEFLSGKGALHETTRSALTRSSSSAVNEIENFLTDQFKLSHATASLIAPLLVKLLPSIGTGAKKKTVAKARTRTITKPKASSSARTAKSSTKKKPVKKTAASTKKTVKKKTPTQAAKRGRKSTRK